MNLLETYRSCLARLNVAMSPVTAIEKGLYVPRPHSVADELVAALELEPSSAHLLVGGIGSGKTTELLMTERKINQSPDVRAIYLDVALEQDLGHLQAGVLLTLVGLELASLLDERQQAELAGAIAEIECRTEVRQDPSTLKSIDDGRRWVPPLVRRPGPTDHDVVRVAKSIDEILAELNQQFVVLFDSLDRVQNLEMLTTVISEDIRALQQLGIGVVVVAPLSALYGPERRIVQYFNDQYLFLWDIDVSLSDSGRMFLAKVLLARIPTDLLDVAAGQRLIELSGGVLRDLIGLAHGAARQAYYKESLKITVEHVEYAAVQAGQKLLFGVNDAGKQTLTAMATGQPFVLATDTDLELLETRRVLQYRQEDGQPSYMLNPLLLPLLTRKGTSP